MPVFEADALRMPFADASFDLVTTAFGFRNLANYEDGLREIFRVLRPGGTVAILEFTEPPPGVMGDLYRWYFRNVLPRIGAMLSGDRRGLQLFACVGVAIFSAGGVGWVDDGGWVSGS